MTNGDFSDFELVKRKTKFLVIPSTDTFVENGPNFDLYGFIGTCFYNIEQRDICRNFCLLFGISDMEFADCYLRINDYSLCRATDAYYYDMC